MLGAQFMEKELISIIMGIYNCARTLPAAIDSILEQTYTNWELIMCDDCSSDDTYRVASEYAKKYPDKVVLIQNEKNMHLAYSLNNCLQYAHGEYVARMDGDDISAPERFEKQIRYLNEHPEVQLVGTAIQQFNEKDGNIKKIFTPEHTDKWTLHKQIPFIHATIMTYKSVYDALSGYTVAERTNRAQDYDLWFRFYAAGFTGDNLQEPLYYVREDMKAIKRRTLRVRMLAFQTTRIGYRMLGYPRIWLYKQFLVSVFKGIMPHKAQYLYRRIQQKKE